jgi:hypothetical protein
MGKLVTTNFNSHNAKQFVESLNETANSLYYVFLGKHTPFTETGFSDDTPPTQNNSPENSFYQPYRDMIYGKQVTTSDIKHMIANNAWTSNTVYAQYDHRDGDLKNKNFFVHVQEANNDYSVFKCIGNNKGAPSIDPPTASETAANDQIYITTTDRYQWKLMYEIPLATYNKFTTSKKIPIIANANVSGNAVPGAIDFVTVNSGGSRYNSVANGVVKVTNVGGNSRMIEIESLVSANVSYSQTNNSVSGTFSPAERIDLLGKHANGDLFDSNNAPNLVNNIANAVSIEANTSQLRVVDIAGNFFGNSELVVVRGQTSNATSLITDIVSQTSTLSANTDFYKGSTFYISAGAGAGAAASISEYIVTGSSRRVLIANDTGFATPSGMIIDTTSRFEITPSVSITGDGSGAEGRAIVNTQIGAIDSIEITNKGQGYTYADATIIGNTGIVSSLQANNANVTVIIGPKGGHGSDPINELYSDTVGISVDFANSEGGNIPANNDFRQIGIIKDPLFSNVVITLANTLTTDNATGQGTSFQDEEVVTQSTSGAYGVVTSRAAGTINLSNVYGQFVTTTAGNTTHRIVGGTSNTSSTVGDFQTSDKTTSNFTTFDQRFRLTGFAQTTSDAAFSIDEVVIQPDTSSSGIVHSINTSSGSVMTITNKKGNWLASDSASGTDYEFSGSTSGASGKFTDTAGPDIIPNTGEIVYIENLSPITRQDDQTERVKLMIEF